MQTASAKLLKPSPAPERMGQSHTRASFRLPASRKTPGFRTPIAESVPVSRGQPLNPDIRARMEAHFGHDFSQVRVHTDAPAARSAQALGAWAYTYGRELVFAPGAYDPQSSAGQHLLAHELAHVVQQEQGRSGSYAAQEAEAEGQARQLAGEAHSSGQPASRPAGEAPLSTPAQPRLQCYTVPGSLACSDLVDWLNSNSPYAPEWAETACNYSFNGGVRTSSTPNPGGGVTVRARGSSQATVSVSCPIDRPSWSPTRRPNRDAEVAAWQAMMAVLSAHERQHRQIGQTWQATLQSRFQAVDFTVTGTDEADATAKASQHLTDLQNQWGADAQAAQSAIDPFRGAVLTCPSAPAAAPQSTTPETTE
jgi:hypothetical protein